MIDEIKNKLAAGGWYRIAFLGDSITSAEWVFPNWRAIVEYVLKTELEVVMGDWQVPWWGIRCYNAGFNGAGTVELLKFIDDELAHLELDMVVFMESYNDKYFGRDEAAIENNAMKIFESLDRHAEETIFTTSIAKFSDETNEVNEKYRRIYQGVLSRSSKKIKTVDVYVEIQKLDLKTIFTYTHTNEDAAAAPNTGIVAGKIDTGHPNVLGNAHIARIMLKEIFSVDFDPERFLAGVAGGMKYPEY